METWSNQSIPMLHGRRTELLMKVSMRPSLEEASPLQSVAQETSHTCVQRDLTHVHNGASLAARGLDSALPLQGAWLQPGNQDSTSLEAQPQC